MNVTANIPNRQSAYARYAVVMPVRRAWLKECVSTKRICFGQEETI